MRKVYVILIGIATLVLISATAVAGEEMFQGFRVVNVIVNGQPLQSDVPAVNFFGRTVLPLRTVAEAAGMDVQWDLVSSTATLTSRFTVDEFNELQSENTRLTIELDAAKKDTDSAKAELAIIKQDLATAKNPTASTSTMQSAPKLLIANGKVNATVVRVIDGDTVEFKLSDDTTERVRLIGIDTPEVYGTVEAYGKEASEYTKNRLAQGTSVTLELDTELRDRYGRLLAYVFIDSELLNETIVRQGYAQVATYPPNVKYVSRFTTAQQLAIAAQSGLWDTTETAPSTPTESTTVQTPTVGMTIISVNKVTERVVIHNGSASTVDLAGWTLVSVTGNQRFIFPSGTTLDAGHEVTVTSGSLGVHNPPTMFRGWNTNVWNNSDSDPARLYNAAGELISSFD